WRYFGDHSIGARSLIEETRKEPRPCRVSYRFSKAMVLNHPFDIQILNRNDAVLFDDLTALLMSKIMPLIGYALMYARYYLTPVLSLFTATRRGTQLLLSLYQFFFFLAKEARV